MLQNAKQTKQSKQKKFVYEMVSRFNLQLNLWLLNIYRFKKMISKL